MKKVIWGNLFMAGSLCLPTANQAFAQQADKLALEEVIVTAQRREQLITEVPVAMTVVTAESLARSGINSSRDLGLVVPGLTLTEQGSFAQPKIRGVGTSIVGPGADGNVALYVDGVYQPSQAAALFDFVDVSSIEVLKGPQGSLYGRNATGGAIVVTTATPSFEPSGKLSLSYGRFDDTRTSVYATGPLSDNVAASIAFMRRSDEGYTKNVATDKKTSRVSTTSVRGKLLFTPTEDLSFTLTGRYINQEDNAALSYSPLGGNNMIPHTTAASLGKHDTSKIALDFDPVAQVKGSGVDFRVNYDAGWGNLVSLTSYSDLSQPFATDVDGTEVPVFAIDSAFDQRTLLQEFIYTTDMGDHAELTAGATYYKDKSSSFGKQFQGGVSVRPLIGRVDTTASAIYGEVTINATDNLAFILGGRYSTEKKEAAGRIGVTGPLLVDASETWDAFTPRVSVRYDLDHQSSVYATYSEGFKSGIFNITGMSPDAVKPEEIKSYEVGYKLNAQRVQFSVAAYMYDYTDIQVYQINNDPNIPGISRISNAASAKIYGLDTELTVRLTEALTLNGGIAYNHSEYDDYRDALVYVPLPAGGNTGVFEDVSGNQLERTPEYTGFATLVHTSELAGGQLSVALTASYNGGYYWDAGNAKRLEQDPFTMVNAEVSWTSPSDKYKVAVFGSNLLNEEVYSFVRTSQFGDTASYTRPWTAGVSLDVSF